MNEELTDAERKARRADQRRNVHRHRCDDGPEQHSYNCDAAFCRLWRFKHCIDHCPDMPRKEATA